MVETTKNYWRQSQLSNFDKLESQVEGFLMSQNIPLWDSFLCYQLEESILGNMLEIGVYKGRSALISSLHLGEQEKFLLIDSTPYIKEAQKHLDPILSNRGYYIQKMSYVMAKLAVIQVNVCIKL